MSKKNGMPEFSEVCSKDTPLNRAIYCVMCFINVVWVAKNDVLVCDPLYRNIQRPFNPKHAMAILRAMMALAVTPLRLVLRPNSEDTYLCLDGQHTRWALVELGFTRLPCVVYPNMTRQEMARAVYFWNGGSFENGSSSRKPWPAIDVFRIALEMDADGSSVQRKVYRTCVDTCNVDIVLYKGEESSKVWHTRSPKPLLYVYKEYGGESGLQRTLNIITGAFAENGAPMKEALRYDVIRGVGMWQHKCRKHQSVKSLVAKLKAASVTPVALLAEATRRWAATGATSRFQHASFVVAVLEDAVKGENWLSSQGAPE